MIGDFARGVDKIGLGFSPLDQGAKGDKAMVYDLNHLTDADTFGGTQFTINGPTNPSMLQAQVIYDPTSGLMQIDMPTWNVNHWDARDGLADAQLIVNIDANGAVPPSLTANDFAITTDLTNARDWTHHPMT